MTKYGTVLATLLLVALALQALGCGSSNSNRILESMTITPANADAQNFANGQVQFTATGTFSKAPSREWHGAMRSGRRGGHRDGPGDGIGECCHGHRSNGSRAYSYDDANLPVKHWGESTSRSGSIGSILSKASSAKASCFVLGSVLSAA